MKRRPKRTSSLGSNLGRSETENPGQKYRDSRRGRDLNLSGQAARVTSLAPYSVMGIDTPSRAVLH